MISIFRYLVLAILLVGVFGCGKQQEAQIQAARSCGGDALYARFNEEATFSIVLPDGDENARTRTVVSYVQDERAVLDFADDFDPTRSKDSSVLPSVTAGKVDLAVRFDLNIALPAAELEAVLATPGKMRVTIDFATNDGGADSCSVDVNLIPPV